MKFEYHIIMQSTRQVASRGRHISVTSEFDVRSNVQIRYKA